MSRLAAVALVLLAAAAPAGAAGRGPTGDRAGLALLASVHRAYADVPGVAVSGRARSLGFRFSLVLRSGVVVGASFVGASGPAATALVTRRGGPTFAREPGSSCWRPLASSDPQAFGNLGLPFPDQPKTRVLAPRRTASGWLLPVVSDGQRGSFAVARSHRVRTITVALPSGSRVVEQVEALSAAPSLPNPEPRC
jgi:hypothetical protein